MPESTTLDFVKQVGEKERLLAIGAAIRSRRRELGMSLRELSKRAGLSIGFLSLVERGRSSLALTSLAQIAKALDMELSRFFLHEQATADGVEKSREGRSPYVQRGCGGEPLAILTSQRTYKMLSPRGPGLTLEPIFVTLQPGDVIDEPHSHEGEEFAYVLSGQLVYIVDDVAYRLGPGDSIHLRSSMPHCMRNMTDEPVQAIWVVTPRLF